MIVAGTGHRPDRLTAFGEPYTTDQHNALKWYIGAWLVENEATQVISGMALGFDQALAAAAMNNHIPFVAAVPFKGQEDRWNLQAKDYYSRLLDAAEEVVYVSPPGYAAWKMHARNKWMVDRCDLVLALYDGSSRGGTYDCVRYANNKGKQVINIWK